MSRKTWKHPDPKSWRVVVPAIRARAGDRCECFGECGLHRTHPGPRRCIERQGMPAHFMRGKVVLTTAHLNAPGGPCACDPLCCEPLHLKSMCQRCHLRYDQPRHQRNARLTRHRGQAEMFA